jgi:hypothetical protein
VFSHSFLVSARRIQIARWISFVGSAFSEFAIPLYLYQQSGSAFHMGMQWVLVGCMRLLGGWCAPRIRWFSNDRRALQVFDAILALGVLAPVLTLSWNPIVGCYAATLLISFVSTLQGGFLESLVGEAARSESNPDAARAWLLSKIENSRHAGMLVGYAAASLVAASVGFVGAFVVDALSFVLSMILIGQIPQEGHLKANPFSVKSYSVLFRPHLRSFTFAQFLTGAALYIYNALHVFILKDRFGASDSTLAIYYVIQYAAYFLGSRIPSKWVERTGAPMSESWVGGFRVVAGLVYVVFALTTEITVFVAANALLSLVIGSSLPASVAMFQKRVPRTEWRGAGAARLGLTSMAGALGAAATSLSVARVGSSPLLFAGGFLQVISGLWIYRLCRGPVRQQ